MAREASILVRIWKDASGFGGNISVSYGPLIKIEDAADSRDQGLHGCCFSFFVRVRL